ncbi:PIN domain-containing protein [Candidatus Poribacteria bacterium]|nr:PIN domain-containing protein [Candidatus Poribacteria bacterium]
MKDKILIDTSIWIDFFRNKDNVLVEKIAMLLKSNKTVYTGIIALELINGAKSNKELEILDNLFSTMDKINTNEKTFFNAGKLGFAIARKGYTINTVDLLIAQIAIENNLSIMTNDEHFNIISKCSHLSLIN